MHNLRIATALDIKRVKILGDSLLVISQANKDCSCSDVNMMAYCQEIRKLENNFDGLEYGHILRGCNEEAEELAKIGSSRGTIPPGIFLHRQDQTSIKKEIDKLTGAVEPGTTQSTQPASIEMSASEVMIIGSDWRTPFVQYIQTGVLPDDKDERDRLRRRGRRYTLVSEEFY